MESKADKNFEDDSNDIDMTLADTDSEPEIDEAKSTKPKLFRLSSRIASLKRRGRFLEPKEIKPEFDFYADDVVTVRGPDKSFWVCRILEDVLETSNQINVAWFDMVEENKYKVSYDDTIYKATILMNVDMTYDEKTELYSMPKKYIHETKQLLKQSLHDDQTVHYDASDDDEEVYSMADNDGEPNGEPATKKRKTRAKKPSTSKEDSISPKKEAVTPKKAPRKRKIVAVNGDKKSIVKPKKGLIPNPNIPLLPKDPLFEGKDKIPLISVKKGLQAVLRNDLKSLESLIADVENIYTVHWQRSPHLNIGPIEYAVLRENKEALTIFQKEKRENVKAEKPSVSLEKKQHGRYNFYTFGHAVRQITTSRGNKEGNNAFLYNDDEMYTYIHQNYELLKLAVKKGLSADFVMWLQKLMELEDSDVFSQMYLAIRNGHHKLAGEYMKKAVKTDAFGYNFLHMEVLCNTTEPLTKFKSTSVTKKPYGDQYFFPLHCVCINPNEKYTKELFASVPEYNTPDFKQWLPIHYAATCVGDGPLKFLLSRGVDPNMGNDTLTTPLILAAKCGRAHNIHALMELKITVETEEGEEIEEPQVKINAKNKKTLTALHYAAKKGHVNCVEVLLEHGAKIDIQTGAGKENMTALGYACQKGHYEVLKVLLEHGAAPDKKMRRNKTALMYACINGHSQLVAHLLRIGVDPNAVDSSENTPIHYASAYGWYHCVQLLLEGGADPNTPNNWKTTPLALALCKSHIEIGDLLLSAEVDVDYPDEYGKTIIMNQMENGFSEEVTKMVKYLIEEKNADVNKVDIREWNMLHFVASSTVYEESNTLHWKTDWELRESEFEDLPVFQKKLSDMCTEITDLLLKKGVNVNAESTNGETPLMIAIKQVNIPLIHQLLKHGAKPSGKDGNALHLVLLSTSLNKESGKEIDLSQMFEESVADFPDDISEEYLQQWRAKRVEQRRQVKVDVVKELLKFESVVNEPNKDGLTPLMISLCEENASIVELLIEKGADPLIGCNKYGANFLHVIAMRCDEGVKVAEVLELLLKKHDFPYEFTNQRNYAGFTPLHYLTLSYVKSDNREELEEIYLRVFKIFIERLKCDILLTVEKEDQDQNSDYRRSPYIKGINFFTWFEQRKKKDDQITKDFKEFGPLGLFSILHILVLNTSKSTSVITYVLESLGRNHTLLNHFDQFGRTPLHLLLDQFDNNSLKTRTGESYEKMVQKLVDYGSNVNLNSKNKKDDSLGTPLTLIAWNNQRNVDKNLLIRVMKVLLKANANVNGTASDGGSVALIYVVNIETDNQGLVIAQTLLKAGANVNHANTTWKRTPLHYAVSANSGDYESLIEMETLLLENGASKTAVDTTGRMPLHYAFYNMDRPNDTNIADPISIVTMLCNIDVKDFPEDMQETPKEELVRNYINHKDETGKSPLHYASLKGATLSCMHLLKMGADHTICDDDGNTPLALALRESHISCGMTLLQAGSKAHYNIITPLAKNAIEEYEKSLAKWKWSYGTAKPVYPTRKEESIFRLTIRNQWQGLAYMMLFVADLPLLAAFKAGVMENNVKLLWTLLKKRTDGLSAKDKSGQNILHFLAYYSKSDKFRHVYDNESPVTAENDEAMDTDVIDSIIPEKTYLEIGKLLLKSPELNLKDLDENNVSPFHFAVLQNNFELVELFLKNSPDLINIRDKKSDRTPLVYAIQLASKEKKMSEKQVAVIKFLINNGAEVDVCFLDLEGEYTTILVKLVALGNIGNFADDNKAARVGCIEYFLKKKTNVNFTGKCQTSPLIRAIQTNQENVVDLLLKEKPDLNFQDGNGKTCLHWCVRTSSYASNENVSILHKLLERGAPLDVCTNDNETALDMAKVMKSGVMMKELIKFMKKCDVSLDSGYVEAGDSFCFETSLAQYWTSQEDVDVGKHAGDEIKKGIEALDKTENKLQPDPNLHMSENGEVYYDPDTNRPYDATLTKVDVRWGLYGLNLTYKLQVVYHKGRDLWLLFNRWGRTGGDHQHQQTPYNNPKDATMEFKKIFKSKTGNDWDNLENFTKKPKKYALIKNEQNPERMLKHQKKLLRKFDLEECAKSTLPDDLKAFMETVTNTHEISYLGSSKLDQRYMPLGLITSEDIGKAKQILVKIKELVEKPGMSAPSNDEEVITNFEQVADLSNEYYVLFPPSNYSLERIKPLNTKQDVERCEGDIQLLTELNPVVKMLLAAQHKRKEISPLDYCYKAVNCHLEMMSPTCEESKLLLKWIYSAPDASYNVTGIYRCDRQNGEYMDTLPEKHLLFHGTKNSHLLSILSYGLQIDPVHCMPTGALFGRGIYFSYEFSKSRGYSEYGCRKKYVLVCEVSSAGYVYPEYNVSTPEDADLWFQTKTEPDPKETVTMPYGAKVLAGRLIPLEKKDQKKNYHWRGRYNEILIRNSKQIRIRYIIQMH